ncbi:keratin, type I cytoskeletal 13-like [Oncorhynchus tshawytscha]|uniref:keratin, type I cytoskeletal 13-like n=1 Tax=Oncorhynchus tshawytscha TaxID=74940 RepID=UPI001C3C9E4D|nr:keratin, type I cytoskeletal 13-like [Oncorhynchus tshawytscha]
MRMEMTGQINVEVDAAPQEDLTRVMSEILEQYETVSAKNQRDLESWFQTKTETLNQEVASSTEVLQTSKSEISDIRRTLQGLEAELQSQLSMVSRNYLHGPPFRGSSKSGHSSCLSSCLTFGLSSSSSGLSSSLSSCSSSSSTTRMVVIVTEEMVDGKGQAMG